MVAVVRGVLVTLLVVSPCYAQEYAFDSSEYNFVSRFFSASYTYTGARAAQHDGKVLNVTTELPGTSFPLQLGLSTFHANVEGRSIRSFSEDDVDDLLAFFPTGTVPVDVTIQISDTVQSFDLLYKAERSDEYELIATHQTQRKGNWSSRISNSGWYRIKLSG